MKASERAACLCLRVLVNRERLSIQFVYLFPAAA